MKFLTRLKRVWLLPVLCLCLCLMLTGCDDIEITIIGPDDSWITTPAASFDMESIPEFSGEPFVIIDDNVPGFSASELSDDSYETYGALDYLGRCTAVEASIGRDLMPTEERGSISHIKPTGWQLAKYDFVDGKYLYNRCHLIGFQLTGENANERNLITGTRYMNVDGMLPFEDMVADYVKETGNHVMYRVTPIFEGKNLIASGVQMEAMSVEDNGEGILFNVYVYNAQPGVLIDYATGENYLGDGLGTESGQGEDLSAYVLNTNSKRFHLPSCPGSQQMNAENKGEFTGKRSELIKMGYQPCGTCKP